MARRFTIRRTEDRAAVEDLHRRLFGPDIPFEGSTYWLVWESGKDYPVGFATFRKSTYGRSYGFLSRAAVLPEARGQGLQTRLIRVRLREAKARGYKGCLTYVANWNSASLINLLKCGFYVYDPNNRKRDRFTYLFCKIKQT